MENKPQSEYTNIYKKYLVEFSNYLDLFARNENILRSEFQRRLNSSISNTPSALRGGGTPAPMAACTNMDFEAGNTSGWTENTNISSAGGTSFARYIMETFQVVLMPYQQVLQPWIL